MKHHMLKRTTGFILSASLLIPLATVQAAPAHTPAASVTQPSAIPASEKVAAAPGSQVKLSKQEALAIAQKYVRLPADAVLTNTSFQNRDHWRSFPVWSFHWEVKGKNGEPGGPAFSVSINADSGELTSYNHYKNRRDDDQVKQLISRDEAAAIAEKFIQQYASGKKAEVRLYDLNIPEEKPPLGKTVYHSFHYARVVNDILFPENGINITVDGEGTVTSFDLNWNDGITFPEPSELITEEQAAEVFKTSSVAKPVYFLPWDRPHVSREKPFLVYQNPFDFVVDAQSGQPLTNWRDPIEEEQEPTPVTQHPLTPHNSGTMLSQEAAAALASKLFGLSDYVLNSVNYHENEFRSGQGTWRLHYETKGQDEKQYVSVTLDAQTGDVLHYYRSDLRPLGAKTENEKKGEWTKEQLTEKAIAALKKFSPAIASGLYLTQVRDYSKVDNSPRVSVHFNRFIDGIQTATGTASVTFNTIAGEIEEYYVDQGGESYPDEPPAYRSAEEAVEAWWDESVLELVYVLPPNREEMIKMGRGEPAGDPVAKLVYRTSSTPFDTPYVLHAETGEWISQATGKPISLHRIKPADLEGHPAEKQLSLMYQYDAISLIDGKLMPERPITRGEMIKMLMITLNQGHFYPERYALTKATFDDVAASSPYFAYVEAAVQAGLLSKDADMLKPEETITRAELADMLVRALGLHKLADYEDMFASNVTDIDADQRGTIAIVTTLGIMTAPDGKFTPARVVSRADAAVAFSRFLEKRNELNLGRAPSYMYEY
ncbi:MAG: S-layer homology domain-containing protein [Brevibacillus sp.]|nr:S-layer homology domain-containing protein [Brevibacillus sp.]